MANISAIKLPDGYTYTIVDNTSGWTDNKGTVTSVRVQASSPVQSSVSTEQNTSLNTTISLADGYGDTKNPYASKTKNYVLAAPSNTNGVPSFRALVAADIPIADWAKASTKPSYNFSEIGSKPNTLSGYGINNAYTKTEVDNLITNLPEPMIFKGSLGSGGTITSLPAAAAKNEGYTYKVITEGTYASQAAKVGDIFISDGSAWILIPSGDEPSGTVTSVAATGATNSGISVTGTPITTNGTLTIDLNLSTAINNLGEGTSAAQRNDYIVAQYAGGGTTTTTYHRRKLSNIFAALNKSDVTTALGYTPPTTDTNYYHTSGSWNGFTYTATPNGGAGALAFTIQTGSSATTVAVGNHTHGNITNGGDITATAPDIGNGDQIIINDHSASKITNGPTFDGSTKTKALTPAGTWETFLTSHQSLSGYVPTSRTIDGKALTGNITLHSSKTATLSTSWSSKQQTVSVTGVTASNTVIVSPAPASYNDYCGCGIYCSAQAANSLTFKCEDVPSNALTVNVLIIG